MDPKEENWMVEQLAEQRNDALEGGRTTIANRITVARHYGLPPPRHAD